MWCVMACVGRCVCVYVYMYQCKLYISCTNVSYILAISLCMSGLIILQFTEISHIFTGLI